MTLMKWFNELIQVNGARSMYIYVRIILESINIYPHQFDCYSLTVDA